MPLRLMCYCGMHSEKDGGLTGLSPQETESIACWWGRTGEMIEAMLRVGFLEKDGEDLKIQGWRKHQGHLWNLKVRNRKVAVNRWAKLKSTVDTSGIPVVYQKSTSGVPLSFPSLSKPYNQEKANQSQKHVAQKFAPPTLQEVRDYISQNHYPVDPEGWLAHYQANGWKVGRNPMRDWRAAVRTWARSDYSKGGQNGRASDSGNVIGVIGSVDEKYANVGITIGPNKKP